MIKSPSDPSITDRSVKSGSHKSTPLQGKLFEQKIHSLLLQNLPLKKKAEDFMKENYYYYSECTIQIESNSIIDQVKALKDLKFNRNKDTYSQNFQLDKSNFEVNLVNDKIQVTSFIKKDNMVKIILDSENHTKVINDTLLKLAETENEVILSVYPSCKN
jgi:stress-induced morphogen